MPTDSETLYRELGRLIEAMPDLDQSPVVNLRRNMIQLRQIFAFSADPFLPRTVILDTNTYCGFGSIFFGANGGSFFDAN